MNDTIAPEVTHKVLSMHEKATMHVTADLMCAHAINIHLKLFSSADIERCSFPTKPGLYVVPVKDDDTIQLKLLEVSTSRTYLRDTDVRLSSGWSVKCRWLFKH